MLFIVEAKYNLADYNSNCLSPLIYLIKIVPKRILSSVEKKICISRKVLEWVSKESEALLCLVLTDGSVVFVLKSSQRKCLNTKFLFAKHHMGVGRHLVSHRPCSSLSAQALGCRCLPRRPLPGSQRGRLRAGDLNRCSQGYGHACGGLRTPLPSRLLRGSTGADAGFPEAPFWRQSLQDLAQLFA